jgi:hypothetical protein
VLPTIKPTSVDLVLTDPPFFMPATHYQSRVAWQRSWSDTSILATFWGVILDALTPAMRQTGHCLAFCDGDSYPVFYPEMYRRFDFLTDLVWDKGSVGLGRVWRHQHELVIAARWNEAVFNADGLLRSDVLRFNATPSSQRDHPVQKPVGLLSALIQPTVPPHGLVLDPFMGSGTTLDAARHLGIRGIGIEAEERYCEIAARRLEQIPLFTTATPPAPAEQADLFEVPA